MAVVLNNNILINKVICFLKRLLSNGQLPLLKVSIHHQVFRQTRPPPPQLPLQWLQGRAQIVMDPPSRTPHEARGPKLRAWFFNANSNLSRWRSEEWRGDNGLQGIQAGSRSFVCRALLNHNEKSRGHAQVKRKTLPERLCNCH